jgi:hypothetical protein
MELGIGEPLARQIPQIIQFAGMYHSHLGQLSRRSHPCRRCASALDDFAELTLYRGSAEDRGISMTPENQKILDECRRKVADAKKAVEDARAGLDKAYENYKTAKAGSEGKGQEVDSDSPEPPLIGSPSAPKKKK